MKIGKALGQVLQLVDEVRKIASQICLFFHHRPRIVDHEEQVELHRRFELDRVRFGPGRALHGRDNGAGVVAHGFGGTAVE
jgi:hypothetical protein